MYPVLRLVLTTLCLIAMTWPLIFWGKPASPYHAARPLGVHQAPGYDHIPRDLLW